MTRRPLARRVGGHVTATGLCLAVAVAFLAPVADVRVATAQPPNPPAEGKAQPWIEEWQFRGVARALHVDETPEVHDLGLHKLKTLLAGNPREDANPPKWQDDWRIHAKLIIPTIQKYLGHQKWEMREMAAEIIGRLGGNADLPALQRLLDDKDEDVRRAAVVAVAKLGGRDELQAILPRLRDPKWKVREAAVMAFGLVGTTDDFPALRTQIKDTDDDVRRAAVVAIARFGGTKLLPDLHLLLKDSEWRVRDTVTKVIGQVGSADDLRVLRPMLNDPDGDVREAAVDAVGRHGSQVDIPALLPRLIEQDQDVRRAAVVAVARLGGPGELLAIRARLSDDDVKVRRAATEGIVKLSRADPLTIRPLLTDKDADIRRAAVVAVAQVGGSKVLPDIHPLLKDAKWEVREAVAEVIGRVGSPDDLSALHPLLTDKDEDVRRAAVVAVAKLGRKELPAIRDRLSDDDVKVRRAAMEVIGRLSNSDDLPDLRTRLKDKDEDIWLHVVEAVGRLSVEPAQAAESVLTCLELVGDCEISRGRMRMAALYVGGRHPDLADVLCGYLARPKDAPFRQPISTGGASQKDKARCDLGVLREHVWSKTKVQATKEAVANRWSDLVRAHSGQWTSADDQTELTAIHDLLAEESNTVGKGYLAGIEKELKPTNVSQWVLWSPFVRTLLLILGLNVIAVVLYHFRSVLGWFTRLLPTAVPVLAATSIGAADAFRWVDNWNIIPWLLVGFVGVEVLLLFALGVFSQTVLRQIADVKPLSLAVPLALAFSHSRRRLFGDYVSGVRNLVTRDRRYATDERYTPLPAHVCTNDLPVGEIVPDPAADILRFLGGPGSAGGHVLIEAYGGRGKSALLREVVDRALKAFEESPGRNPLPVLLTGTGESLKQMAADSLGATLVTPDLLPRLLAGGDVLLVMDGVSESGLDEKVLAAFLNGPYRATTRVLLGGRPVGRYRQPLEATPRWMTVEPRGLTDDTLDGFVTHYESDPLPVRTRWACRGSDGTYVPILVRMAMTIDPAKGIIATKADLYREYLLRLFGENYSDEQRLQLLAEAARWCLETYWLDGGRVRHYEATALQQALLQAGVLVPVDGGKTPRTVRFVHDSVQGYLTACGLYAEDPKYPTLPAPADATGPWNRRRVQRRIAGDPIFVQNRTDGDRTGGTELLRMFLFQFTVRGELRRDLKDEIDEFIRRQHQNLRRDEFQAALPPDVDANDDEDNRALLKRAAEAALKADEASDSVDRLGKLFGCLAPLVQKLRGEGR